MAKTTNVVELKDWILRQLGAPQNQIEVTEEQIFDAIDEAVELFVEYHYDGCSQNVILCKVDEDLAAQKSIYLDGVFTVNKVISSARMNTGNSALATGFLRLFYGTGNVGYAHGQSTVSGIFSELNGFSMTSYSLWQQYQHEWNKMFNPETRFSFNSVTGELKIIDEILVDSVLAFEVYTPIGVKISESQGISGGDVYNHLHFENPSNPQWIGGTSDPNAEVEYFDQQIFDHRWVKAYARAMTKRTWGEVMSKFESVRLPGGGTVNGQRIYDQAVNEMEQLREELENLTVMGIELG